MGVFSRGQKSSKCRLRPVRVPCRLPVLVSLKGYSPLSWAKRPVAAYLVLAYRLRERPGGGGAEE